MARVNGAKLVRRLHESIELLLGKHIGSPPPTSHPKDIWRDFGLRLEGAHLIEKRSYRPHALLIPIRMPRLGAGTQ